MMVELLIGPNAGTIVDLPVHAAEAELQFGTARKVVADVRATDSTKIGADKNSSTDKPSSISKRVRKTS